MTLSQMDKMSPYSSRSLHGAVRLVLAAAIATVALAAGPLQVSAECDGPYPSLRDALATAKRVVIGDVIAVRNGGLVEAASSDGWSSRFTLSVLYTPVGRAPATMQINDLPTQPCADRVIVREGDRIAIAFGATDYTPPIKVNAVAWIRGASYSGETITTGEVFRLLGLAQPDTSTVSVGGSPGPSWGPLIALVAGALAGSLAWHWRPPNRGRRVPD
jgi:hypothetical protein